MLSLASFSVLTRSAVRLVWIAGAIALTVYVTAVAGGTGDPLSDGYARLFLTLFLAPATLCLLRAVLVREQRLAWAACGIGIERESMSEEFERRVMNLALDRTPELRK
jgi:hypothetical protein